MLITGKAPASRPITIRDTHTSKLPYAALFSDRILRVGSPGPQRLSLVQQLREKEDLLAAAPTEAPGRKTLVGLLSFTTSHPEIVHHQTGPAKENHQGGENRERVTGRQGSLDVMVGGPWNHRRGSGHHRTALCLEMSPRYRNKI